MLESTVPIDHSVLKDRNTLRKTAQGVAIATGVLAASYGAFRLVRSRRADRSYEERAKEWLKLRLENLQSVLELTMEKADDMREDIEKTLHKTLRLVRRAECLKPNVRERLHIAIDKMLLKLKLDLSKGMQIKTDMQLEILENFYSELRGWIFRIRHAEAEVEEKA